MMATQFDIVPSFNIDANKWALCLQNSEANLLYASYNYLQQMADNWSAVVVNDYEAVMPFVWRKKWSFAYCYDAPFIQQSGMFGQFDSQILIQAVKLIEQRFPYGDIRFNYSNSRYVHLKEVKPATNLILSLQHKYENIYNNYHAHLKRKLLQASKHHLTYCSSANIRLCVETFQRLYSERLQKITTADYNNLQVFAESLLKTDECIVREVCINNELLATALFIKYKKRLYNLLPSTTGDGRKKVAMHYLLDNVISEFAGNDLSLDFEGSDIAGIKQFYTFFGAINESYFVYHYNKLPVIIRLLKR